MFGDRNLNQLLVWVACEASEAGLPPRGRSGERQVRVLPFNEWHVSVAKSGCCPLMNGMFLLPFITLCVCVMGSRNKLEGNCTALTEKRSNRRTSFQQNGNGADAF